MRRGDLKGAKEFLERRPDAVSAKITCYEETSLHVAVAAGHLHVVEELVGLMSEADLENKRDWLHYTALLSAVIRGKVRMAECMLRKNNKLISIRNLNGDIPVVSAMIYGQIETARYLYNLTPLDDLMPEKDGNGANLLTNAIYTRALGKKYYFQMEIY